MTAGKSYRRAAALGLVMRPEAEADIPFLGVLYASTRMEELVATSWTEAQKAAFLDMQFQAQRTHYRRFYPEAAWLVAEHAAQAIGRLYVECWPSQHRIIDIAFLPAHCGKGFGSALLNDLIDEAAAAGKAVSVHVEKHNPARRLYLRLGFVVVEDKGVYDLMARAAPSRRDEEIGQLKTAS